MRLSDTYRASDVFRWQIVKVIRPQSIAEHSYQVAMIAHQIIKLIEPNQYKRETIELEILRWALYHDTPEVMTGDIATPLKQYLKNQGTHGCIEELEGKVCPNFDEYRPPETSLVYKVVKLADILEAIKFLSENAATKHGEDVMESLKKDFDGFVVYCEVNQPEINWTAILFKVRESLFGQGVYLDDILSRQGEEK